MPELPEVETVVRGLAPIIVGNAIIRVQINRPDLRYPLPQKMISRLTGSCIKQVRRRSKYILADLSSGETLLIHLGMSGRILVESDQIGLAENIQTPPAKHDHVILEFHNGVRIIFNDPRRFGIIDLFNTDREQFFKLLSHLGPEPLSNSFNPKIFAKQVKKRRSPIKSVLLDQRIIAGLGNIYVCESLYRARISPKKISNKISVRRLESLVPHIKDILIAAIAAGGSSLRDFKQTNGELGYFQHSFDVYGREDRPCKRSSCTGTISRIVQAGRSSFYCKKCQR